MRKGQAGIERNSFSARRLRGQAAIEYLMTYGWAILALVIVIAVLVSTGIFSPNYLVSEECNFGSSLKCSFALFNEGGNTKVLLTVFNGYPYKVRIKDIALQTLEEFLERIPHAA